MTSKWHSLSPVRGILNCPLVCNCKPCFYLHCTCNIGLLLSSLEIDKQHVIDNRKLNLSSQRSVKKSEILQDEWNFIRKPTKYRKENTKKIDKHFGKQKYTLQEFKNKYIINKLIANQEDLRIYKIVFFHRCWLRVNWNTG